jgi:ClpX C4-type zinc finger protein
MGFWDWLRFRKRKRERPEPASLHCSFCGRSGLEAKKLIAGRDRRRRVLFLRQEESWVQVLIGSEKATICDECLGLCRDILAEERV